MDVILEIADRNVFTPFFYPTSWSENYWLRQFITLNLIACCGALFIYFVFGTLSYCFVFDKRLLKHPLALENQVWLEICYTCKSIPFMGILSSICFLFEVRGHSKLYDRVDDSKFGWLAITTSVVVYILFTDCLIYFIHYFLHHRLFYKSLHKPHHCWKVPTPFASHAFHPVDGFSQSLPYHLYVFIFPMHKFVYLILYVLVNVWTISIHDGDFRVPGKLRPFINGSAHHTDHHLFYSYNYGQYFTFWDKMCGTFRDPSAFEGKGPLDVVKKMEEESMGEKKVEEKKVN